MIQTLLVDDEKNATEVLAILIGHHCPEIQLIGSCHSGDSAIESIVALKPDLVFLDIEMPLKNGFDVLNATQDIGYDVIFTTAYDQFAIKAFKYAAVDYLLKPVDIQELKSAVQRVVQRNALSGEKQALGRHLLEIMRQLDSEKNKSSKIALNVGDSLQLIEAGEIVRCESDSNYTHVFLRGGRKITIARTLKEIEETLDGLGFFRIHQSHLINLEHITKFLKTDGGYLIMDDGSHLTISRSRKEKFLEKFRKV